jgi:hypothetical protein
MLSDRQLKELQIEARHVVTGVPLALIRHDGQHEPCGLAIWSPSPSTGLVDTTTGRHPLSCLTLDVGLARELVDTLRDALEVA